MSAGDVLGGLFYLRVTSLRNAVVARFARLKQPRYLIGAVVGGAYFYSLVFRRMNAARPSTGGLAQRGLPIEYLPTLAAVGALFLTVFVLLMWVWPRARAALAFSEAEIAFLFPAPIARRTLIHYRLISGQLRILFTSLLIALFSTGLSFGPLGVRILGWWLIIATLDLHAVASSFVRTRLLDSGMTSLRRSAITIAIAAVVVGAALVATWRGLRAPGADDLAGPAAVGSYVASLLASAPLKWLLLPASWVLRPVLSADLRSFLLALGPALLVYALHYAWVLRAEVSFEEASIAKAEKRAVRRAAQREGHWKLGRAERKSQSAPFKLTATGRPEIAFLWKNLLGSASYLRPRGALIAAVVIFVVCSWLTRADVEPFRTIVGVFAAVAAGYTFVFGPMFARQDLRLDLQNTDMLKTYPLRGWQVVLGEVLTPVAILTVLLWLLLLAAALTFVPPPVDWWSRGLEAVAVTGIALTMPLLCAMQVLVLNAATVLFPAWMPRGADRTAGFEVLGQRLFFFAGLLLVLALTLLPAVLVAGGAFLVTLWLAGALAAACAAVVAALAVLIVEIVLLIAWVGKSFEKFDLSAELRP